MPCPAPPPPPSRLRTQWAWACAGLAMALALLWGLTLAIQQKNRAEDGSEAALRLLAGGAAQQLADGLSERSQLVQVLAQSPEFWRDGLEAAEVTALMARIPQLHRHSAWVGVLNKQGQVVQSSDQLLQGRNMASMPWFTAGSKTLYVSDPGPAKLLAPLLPASVTGEALQLVSFSAPIHADGALLGVLCLQTRWDWAHEVLQTLRSTLSAHTPAELFIFDRSGKPLYAPQGLSTAMPTTRPPTQPPHAAALRWSDSDQGFLTFSASVPARSPASDLGWQVVARQPLASSAWSPSLLLATLLVGLLVALLSAAMLWQPARRMLGELRRLSLTAQRIEAGERTPLPLLHSSRELQQLSQVLRGMVQQLETVHAAAAHAAQREQDLLAGTDLLTGLLNRRGFSPQLQFAIALARRSGRPLSLMLLGLDPSQPLHDHLDHELGSLILKSLASHLQARLRDSDLVARWSDTEFVALLPDTPSEDTQRIALDILGAIAQHPWPQVGQLTLSIGITALRPTLQDGTEDGENALLQRGEEALQASRQAGGNQAHFQP